MFELHIEFNTGSLILSFCDGEKFENAAYKISHSQKFVSIYSDVDNKWYYINTDNVLYFYPLKIQFVKNSDGGDF